MNTSHPNPLLSNQPEPLAETDPAKDRPVLENGRLEKEAFEVASGMDDFLDDFVLAGSSGLGSGLHLSEAGASEAEAGKAEAERKIPLRRAWGTVKGKPVQGMEKTSSSLRSCPEVENLTGQENAQLEGQAGQLEKRHDNPSGLVQARMETYEEVLSVAENREDGHGRKADESPGDSLAEAREGEKAILPSASIAPTPVGAASSTGLLPAASGSDRQFMVPSSYDFSSVPVHLQDDVADFLDVPTEELFHEEAEASSAQAEVVKGRDLQKLTDRHYKMMLLQASGMSRKNIAKIFDLSIARVSAITNSGLYIAAMELLRDKIREHTITRISGMQDMALNTLQDILLGSEDEKVRLAAVKQILALGDNKPPARLVANVQHEHSFGQKVQEAMRLAQERRETLDAEVIEVPTTSPSPTAA